MSTEPPSFDFRQIAAFDKDNDWHVQEVNEKWYSVPLDGNVLRARPNCLSVLSSQRPNQFHQRQFFLFQINAEMKIVRKIEWNTI